MSAPETRASLLLRLHDRNDGDAWTEFARLYRPVVLQMARAQGLQSADADDLAQQVLWAVSNAIERFEHCRGRAQFRTWLKTIARNAIINAITRKANDQPIGGSEAMDWLAVQPEQGGQTEVLQWQYRREVFQVAANAIRSEVRPAMWEAFYLTAVEQCSANDVAKRIGCSVGSVYTSRSRVIRKLREKVQELDLVEEEFSDE
ncbi:sigma-70 family RNA polymerase sigma factor [Roseiconus lacunae]|uniref:RNA polymerase sigma factor n=1 Tax=Roseiconus lacunae TaxID=2605694 RepID=UPI00308A43C2|nr:sigma-70 family RNA polymerase sigma factor [Stieleria sp. HD01]